jgi:hypothetical protein
LTVTPVFRNHVVHHEKMKNSLDDVLKWDFKTIHVCHSRPQHDSAREIFLNEAYKLLTTKP